MRGVPSIQAKTLPFYTWIATQVPNRAYSLSVSVPISLLVDQVVEWRGLKPIISTLFRDCHFDVDTSGTPDFHGNVSLIRIKGECRIPLGWTVTIGDAFSIVDKDGDGHLDELEIRESHIFHGTTVSDQTYSNLQKTFRLLKEDLAPISAERPLRWKDVSVRSEHSPFSFYLYGRLYNHYLDFNDVDALDDMEPNMKRRVEEIWLPVIQSALKDPSSCVSMALKHTSPDDRIPIVFESMEAGRVGGMFFQHRVSNLFGGGQIHIFVVDEPIVPHNEDEQRTTTELCHELGHRILYDHANRLLYWWRHRGAGHGYGQVGRDEVQTSPSMAFNEGFASLFQMIKPLDPWIDPTWKTFINEFHHCGTSAFFKLRTFEEREANEYFVAVVLRELAVAEFGNIDRIAETTNGDIDNFDSLSNFLRGYLLLYPEQRLIVQKIMKNTALSQNEPLPVWIQTGN